MDTLMQSFMLVSFIILQILRVIASCSFSSLNLILGRGNFFFLMFLLRDEYGVISLTKLALSWAGFKILFAQVQDSPMKTVADCHGMLHLTLSPLRNSSIDQL